ncbi:MAG TPA: hypothetical protein VGF48_17210 [Thermoanaerobaculia bacterium]|jgi:hypothetical protein
MTRRIVFSIVLVVCMFVGLCTFRVTIDEQRLASIKVGWKMVDVERALGTPTAVFRPPLPPACAPRTCARTAEIAAAALYVRRWRDSLFVYVDSTGRIVCTERVSISYDRHLLQARGHSP